MGLEVEDEEHPPPASGPLKDTNPSLESNNKLERNPRYFLRVDPEPGSSQRQLPICQDKNESGLQGQSQQLRIILGVSTEHQLQSSTPASNRSNKEFDTQNTQGQGGTEATEKLIEVKYQEQAVSWSCSGHNYANSLHLNNVDHQKGSNCTDYAYEKVD